MADIRRFNARFCFLAAAKQEDDEVVLQIVYLFHQFVVGGKEEVRKEFMSGYSDAVHYMIDLMNDANPQIGKLCDATLDVVAVRKLPFSINAVAGGALSIKFPKFVCLDRFSW